MLVLASGSFAASGDLTLWQVFAVTLIAFIIGDQAAYRLAAAFGPKMLGWMRGKERLAPMVDKSEALLQKRGKIAVILSHTILSPTCPYISYLCGAGGMRWRPFSFAAMIGAALWTAAYVAIGFVFASQLTQVAEILSNSIGVLLAILVAFGCIMWLRNKWRDARETEVLNA